MHQQYRIFHACSKELIFLYERVEDNVCIQIVPQDSYPQNEPIVDGIAVQEYE